MITQEQLKENLIYEPETGMFTRISTGNFCETYSAQGYIVIKIKGKLYKAHRLAFLYMTGAMPDEVDHIDCVKDNNAWNNLREASRQENQQNKYENLNNKSGFKGVHWHIRRKKWYANIRIDGKKVFLGSFYTDVEAYRAYVKAAEENHKEFAKY